MGEIWAVILRNENMLGTYNLFDLFFFFPSDGNIWHRFLHLPVTLFAAALSILRECFERTCKLYNTHWNFLFHRCSIFKLLSSKTLFMNRKDNRNCWKVRYFFFQKTANFTGKLLQNYKSSECEIFRILLKHLSNHLSILVQFAWLYL